MSSTAWYRSRAAGLIASILLPPLGLVLLWARARTSTGGKLLRSAAMVGLSLAYLYLFFGLRVEVDGSGAKPLVSLYRADLHYSKLERSRAQQREESPPPPPDAVTEPTPVPAQSPLALHAETRPNESKGGAPPAAPKAYWTDFRGPRRDGIYAEMETVQAWPPGGLPRLWRQPVGGGYASFVVADGKAFTIEQRRNLEVVAAYDLATGRELWTDSWPGMFQESMGGDGPRATPTWEGGRLYALGATGELRCYNATSGKTLWSKNILSDNGANNLQWGMAAAPLVVDEKVIVLPGGSSGRSVVAYHKLTGQPVWKVLDDPQAYTAPMLVTLGGQRQILVVSARRVMGLTVEDGKLLWDYPWETQFGINASQPLVVSDTRFFISAGYGHGAAVVEVTRSGDDFSARTVWENTQIKNKFNSSVLHQGHIYGLDEAILVCINAATGERKWKSGRYGYGQLLLAGGNLIVLTESGDLVLVRATPERHEELARFSALDGKTWNHPAIDGGLLLVRNTTEMACFRISTQ